MKGNALATKSRVSAELNGASVQEKNEAVVIDRINPKILELEIEGITPLIVHAWDQKCKLKMLQQQQKKAKQGRETRNPEADYQASRYIATDGWDGIPANGVKGCLVNACRATDVPMTLAKRMIFIMPQGVSLAGQELVRINGEPAMREDMVRIDNGKADLRYRPAYNPWTAKLEIQFLSSIISAEQVCNLVELAGFIEGLCEWRPGAPKNHTGNFGRFRIKRKE